MQKKKNYEKQSILSKPSQQKLVQQLNNWVGSFKEFSFEQGFESNQGDTGISKFRCQRIPKFKVASSRTGRLVVSDVDNFIMSHVYRAYDYSGLFVVFCVYTIHMG